MKRLVIALALLAALPVGAQTNWKNIEKLIGDGSYKTAYAQAEKVFKTTRNSTDLLASAYYMSEMPSTAPKRATAPSCPVWRRWSVRCAMLSSAWRIRR